jgi:hypothetical protein
VAALQGKNIIHALQKKWTTKTLLIYLFMSSTIGILVSAIIIKQFDLPWYVMPLMLAVFATITYFFLYKKPDQKDVTSFIDRTIPAAEESAFLILKPADELNFFERLQLQKVERAIDINIQTPQRINIGFKVAFIMLIASILLSLFLLFLPINFRQLVEDNSSEQSSVTSSKPEVKLPQIKSAQIKIAPPVYTGKSIRQQNRFNIVAEEGAIITWSIYTTTPVKELVLVFNDKSVLKLSAANNQTKWLASRQVVKPGFYQVKIGNILSELYRIEVIPDKVPIIVVNTPKPNTLIEAGQPPRTNLSVTLADDYGISRSTIFATIASGSGEAVKFQEKQIPFANFASGRRQYQLQQLINLSSLGMKAGDELYFYVSAIDNKNQEKRSDILIVRLENTEQLLEAEGMMSGVNIKPEFFRSQRQIIIETEQLLKSRDTMSLEAFKNKSNDLGTDQKLLRLRYGKFLGEETDVEIGGEHGDEEGHDEAEEFGNTKKLQDAYAHLHDNSEDATFFDAETKKQLKATLAEMWKAELQLRTIKPKDALPFEYKALKLLKELQQSTRVYVAKTGMKTTPLKPEKRLTGELDKIIQPVSQRTIETKSDYTKTLRQALGVLEIVRNKEPLDKISIETLEQASMQLSNKAAAEPANYLSSLESLRRILRKEYKPKDINIAGSGLQRMLSSSAKLPQQTSTTPGKLSQQYFRNLNRRND